MNSYEDFVKEYEEYTKEELEMIYETQKELYTEDEMRIIKQIIDRFEEEESDPIKRITNHYTKEEKARIEKLLPQSIMCPKCEGPNLFSNDKCDFCGADLEKEKYYTLEYYEEDYESRDGESNTFRYVISFLIPLVGFILGALLPAKDNPDEKAAGQNCIVLAIISVIISTVSWMILLF